MEGNVPAHALCATLAAMVICLGVTGAAAQPPMAEFGTTVIPTGELPVWEFPPSGLSLSRGRTVATIDADSDPYTVIDTRVIRSILWGDSYYVRLRSEDDQHECAERSCWVYLGREREGQWNLTVAEDSQPLAPVVPTRE